MTSNKNLFSNKQLIFKELFVGTLIYAVVMGFYNDYTSVIYVKSFSIIFYAAVVLETLTYLTFFIKDLILEKPQGNTNLKHRLFIYFCVWIVFFLSKFVFYWAIDSIFGNNVNINGFYGIFILVISVTIVHKLAGYIFNKLSD